MRERKRSMVGRVVSDKMDETVVVEVERLRRHPLYKKEMRVKKRFKAHDATDACRVGDMVRIKENRPLSREKRWVVEEILGE